MKTLCGSFKRQRLPIMTSFHNKLINTDQKTPIPTNVIKNMLMLLMLQNGGAHCEATLWCTSPMYKLENMLMAAWGGWKWSVDGRWTEQYVTCVSAAALWVLYRLFCQVKNLTLTYPVPSKAVHLGHLKYIIKAIYRSCGYLRNVDLVYPRLSWIVWCLMNH